MKRIGLLLLGLLIAPGVVWGQARVLNSNSYSNGNAGASKTISVTLPITTAGSNIKTQVQGSCATQPAITDQVGHVFSLDVGLTGPNASIWFFSAGNPTATTAPTITATFSSACNYLAISVEEVQGTQGIDGQPLLYAPSVQSTTAISLGSIATTASGDFIVSAISDNYGNGGLSAGSGFTFLSEPNSPTAAEFEVVGSNGEYPVGYTISHSGYKVTAIAVAYAGSNTAPPTIPQVPVTLNLYFPNGTKPTGNLTLYSVVTNANGTIAKTTLSVWPLTNGSTTASVPAAMSGTYEFDLNGSVNTSLTFQPGVYQELLSAAGSITAAITLDPVTGQPLPSYTFQVLPKSN